MVSTIFLLKLQDLSIGELAIVVNDLKGVAFFAEEKSWKIYISENEHEPRKKTNKTKTTLTFHYIGWLIGILIMAYSAGN